MSARPPTGSLSSSSLGLMPPETCLDPDWAQNHPTARLLLRVDGVFEAVLGAILVSSPVTGLYSELSLPHPATSPVVVGFGVLLLPLLRILWRVSRSPRREMVLALAGANGAGALILALWVLTWNGAFHPAGAGFVLTVAGILAILAVLQAWTALASS